MDKVKRIQLKKNEIIDALKKCLDINVYSKITIQEIAETAGLSKGGLLHYFQSKDEIYLELIDNFFNEIKSDQSFILNESLQTNEKAGISALFGVEKFVMNTQTIKILLNMFLYSFEDPKIKDKIKSFLHHHLKSYEEIIKETRNNSAKKYTRYLSTKHTARIVQIILFAAGIFEAIDPIEFDQMSLVNHIVKLLKN